MSVSPPKDMPCKRDCPNRKPGCLCDKKKEWDEAQRARKNAIIEEKKRIGRVLEVRNPERVKKVRRK